MDNKEKFISLLKSTNRKGVNQLLSFLEEKGFFEAPASTRFHLSKNGGLLQHSINVYDVAMKVRSAMIELDERLKDAFPEDSVIATIKFTAVVLGESESIEIPKGSVIDEEEFMKQITEALKEEGYEVKGVYADEDFTTEFNFAAELNADTTMYVDVVELVETPNPGTADAGVTAAIVFAALAILGLGFAVRKRCFN